jgi:TRAP-type transport system periplasmic protein
MMLRHLFAAVSIVGLAAGTAVPAGAAEPTVLKFAYPAPPNGWPVTKGIAPWSKKVEDASGGELEIKLYPGGSISNFRNVYDRLLNGVAEIAFGTFGTIQDQYPKSSVAGLPFLAESSLESGLALWRLYAKGVIADEYARVKPIALFGFGTTGLHFTKRITKLDELKGVKIFANGRAVGRIVTLVGAVPITSNSGALYQGLSRGLADGTAFTWSGIESFKLVDVVKYHLDMPFGKTGGYLFMNKQAYARLPERSRQAIDRFSGEALTKIMCDAADGENDGDRAKVLANPGQESHSLTAQETERLRKMLAPLDDEWVAATPDGAKVLAAFRAEVAAIRKGK